MSLSAVTSASVLDERFLADFPLMSVKSHSTKCSRPYNIDISNLKKIGLRENPFRVSCPIRVGLISVL